MVTGSMKAFKDLVIDIPLNPPGGTFKSLMVFSPPWGVGGPP